MIVRILRRESSESEPYWQEFEFEPKENMTVAGLLTELNDKEGPVDINGNPVPRIYWENSCLQGVCGACAMVINHRPGLACETFLHDLKGDTLILEPLKKFPTVRDLVVDRSVIQENLKKANAYIETYEGADRKEYEHMYDAAKCLKCGLCMEVCPNYKGGDTFYGAAFTNDCYLIAERSSSRKEKIVEDYRKSFGKGCSKALACEEICPMHISALWSMSTLNKLFSLVLVLVTLLTGCGADPEIVADVDTTTGTAVVSETPEPTSAETATPAAAAVATPDPERYVHGEDGYFNLDEEGIPVHLRAQRGGTCWLYASAVSMETGYEMNTGREVEIDPYSLLDKIYGDDKKEGIFIDASPVEFGGMADFVVGSLTNGFDQYVLDRAIQIKDVSIDNIKECIKKYGGMYIGIPDTATRYKAFFHGYTTINWPDAKPKNYDHSITIVGWDDHFPKDYFVVPATRDGAWITVNSRSNSDYYYVSYDTPPDHWGDYPTFMSMSDAYSSVATHDYGVDEKFIKTGEETVTANVFHQAGTLAAVGTYSKAKEQDIKIEIYDADFKKVLYTQEAHLDGRGYHTISLDTPLDVTDYAIAIHYTKGAPVEGPGWKYEEVHFRVSSKKGESFVLVDGKWLDLHDKNTRQKIGAKKKVNNCCIKGLYQ